MMASQKFCIIGAGAMGCLYGGRLAQAGYAVTLLDRWQAHVRTINETGLILDDASGSDTLRLAATCDADAVGTVDAVIVLVDANNTVHAAYAAASMLAPEGIVLTLQNGIGNIEALAEVIGAEKVMGGLSYASAAVAQPGQVVHTHAGPTWLGEQDGRRSPRLAMLAEAFDRAGLNPIIVDDISALIWDKWVLNSAINALCAITGLRQGEIPRTSSLEQYQDRILDEIFAVVAAKKIHLHDPDLRATIKAQCWKKFNKPSMLQHMEMGKQTEIGALNGKVVQLGAESGVPTPFNEALTLLIKAREKARRQELGAETIDYAALEAATAAQPRS